MESHIGLREARWLLRERFWLDVLGRAAEEGLPGVIFTLVFEPMAIPGFYERLVQRVQAHSTTGARLRVEPRGTLRMFVLDCPHGETEAWATNPDDGMVLAYARAYHESREACGCAEELFGRLRTDA
jgi:hypothetical protein